MATLPQEYFVDCLFAGDPSGTEEVIARGRGIRMLSDYLKGYIDALCYPIYRGARNAGCVEVPVDQLAAATERIQRIGCLAVEGLEKGRAKVEVWAVRNHTIQEELERLLALSANGRSEYHSGVGQLLGYSEQHIRIFLETQRPTV